MRTRQISTTKLYVDGGGANAHGIAGCAWMRPGVAFHVERGSGWTCNEAEYRALISALRYLPVGSRATVFSDSLLMVRQVAGECATSAPRLQFLLNTVRRIILKRELLIELVWIPRNQNLADALLRLNIPGTERCTLKKTVEAEALRHTSHHRFAAGGQREIR